MNPINSVVIEDDPLQMEILCDLITSSFPHINIVGKGGLFSEGVNLIRTHQPDLVFLDIDLPDRSGFDMLDELNDMKFDVIFVTAHEKYALEAHQYATIGFLIKPVSKEKLAFALKKIKESTHHDTFGVQVQQLLHNFRN